MRKYPKRCLKGFAWWLDPGSGLCELRFHSLAASVQYCALVANTPTEWKGLYVYPWWTGMPASEGWHVGPFLRLQLPRTIQLMPQPCIVGSRHKPLSIDPPCFPCGHLYLEAAIVRSPCWLGREGRMWGVWRRTIPMLIASGAQGITLQFPLHLSVGEVMARR